jgi:hypothetical protein
VALIRRLPKLSPDELKQMQEIAGEESVEGVRTETELNAGKRGKNMAAGAKDQSQEGTSNDVERKSKSKGHTHQPGANPHHH